jgi:hypothetical protein
METKKTKEKQRKRKAAKMVSWKTGKRKSKVGKTPRLNAGTFSLQFLYWPITANPISVH